MSQRTLGSSIVLKEGQLGIGVTLSGLHCEGQRCLFEGTGPQQGQGRRKEGAPLGLPRGLGVG